MVAIILTSTIYIYIYKILQAIENKKRTALHAHVHNTRQLRHRKRQMDFHKNKGKEIEGAVSESKKKGKEKANASDQTKKEFGTFHLNYEMDIKKTINLDMPRVFKG